MNNTLYRIIFNQARGQWMAVQETASGRCKPASSGRSAAPARPAGHDGLSSAIKLVAFLTLLGLGAAAWAADIVASPNAAVGQRPTVDQAANGRPVVQIAAPSGAGVSHNQYQRFNVPSGGALLNNSATLVQTQLAGFIDGNRNLAGGPAKVILNEVTHPNPSQLNGYLEVAGQRAEVVIANPWGITCSGCGFINTDRATLTTGVPQMSNGALTGYRVEGGSVRIDGQGLNASNLDSFSIIARAMEINADLQAKTLNVVLGRNQVDKATLVATPLAPDAASVPAFALDVSKLGGMYAGAITLVGTEKGVGVNSQGQIAATEGALTLTSAGDLRLSGKTSAAADANLTAGARLNIADSLAAGQNLILAAETIQAAQGAVAAAGLNEDGSLKDSATLQASTGSLNNAGQWLTAGRLEVEADTLANTGGTLAAKTLNLTSRTSLDNRDGGQIMATGDASLKTASLHNTESLIGANGSLKLDTTTLDNDHGTLQGRTLDAQASTSLTNTGGQILADRLSLTTKELTNTGGTLSATSDSRLTADTFTNSGGTVHSDGTLSWSGTTLSNLDQGVIHAKKPLTLDGNLDNRVGEVSSQQSLTLHGSFSNQAAGLIRAGTDLTITGADPLSNLGSLSAGGSVTVTAASLDNQGVIGAGLDPDGAWVDNASLTLATTGQQRHAGTLLASGGLDLHGGDLALSGQTLARGTTRLHADGVLTQRGGTLESGGQLTLEGQHIALADTTVTAHTGATLAATQTLASSQTTLLANGQLGASAGALTLGSGTTWHAGQQADLQASSLELQAGSVLKSDGSLTLTGDTISLTGKVRSEGNMRVDGDTLALDGETASAAALTVQAQQLSATGQTTAKGALTVAADDLSLSRIARLGSQSTLQLSTPGHFDNLATLQGQDIRIEADGLTQQGIVAATNDLTIQVGDTLTNTRGHVLFAGRNQTLYARNLVNQEDATIWAGQNLVIQRNAAGDRANSLSNTLGRIEAWQGHLTLRAQQIDNTGRDPSAYVASRSLPGNGSYEGWSGTMWAGNSAQQATDFLARWRPYIPQQYWSELPNYTYNRIDYYLVNSWEQYLPAGFAAKSSELLAGGNMTIEAGQLNNRFSQIEAGGNLTLTAESVTNTGLGLSRYLQIVREYERASCPTCASWPSANQYTTVFAGNVASPLSVKSTIKAGGTLTLNVGTLDNANGGETLQNQAYAVRPELAGNVNVTVAEGGLLPQSAIPQDAGFGIVLDGQGSLSLDQLALPAGQSGLFVASPGGNHGYLIETNPAFASYKNFISSDYMLSRLGYDPSRLPLRLGDAWFENQLIERQLLGLTGNRQIANGYQGLMDNALALQKQLDIKPGQRLSAEQIARLDRDIVWLEERTVNGQTALVPQIYLASATRAKLTPDGAIIAGADVVLNADIVNNQGVLTANKKLLVQADTLANTNGLLQGTDRLTVITDKTLSSRGGLIRGGDVGLQAGTDLALDATALQSSGDTTLIAKDGSVRLGTVGTDYRYTGVTGVHKGTQTWTTEGTQQHTTQAAVGGKLAIQAGNDIAAQGAELAVQGSARLAAGGDIALGAAEDRYHDFSHTDVTSKSPVSRTQKQTDIDASGTRLKGSSLIANQATLRAGHDIGLSASTLTATQDLTLQAARDITVSSAEERSGFQQLYSESHSGLTGSLLGGIAYRKSTAEQSLTDQDTVQVASTLNGTNVLLEAGRDATVKASTVLADQGIDLSAGRNVAILAATNHQAEQTRASSSGMTLGLSGGLAPRQTLLGTYQSSQNGNQSNDTQSTSLLSANNGDLTITAGTDASQRGTGQGKLLTQGANLQAKGAVNLTGNAVTLEAVSNQAASQYHSDSKSFTVGSQLAGTVGSVITGVYDTVQEARSTSNDRLQGALALKAGYDAYRLANGGASAALAKESAANAADQAKGASNGAGAAFGVSVNLGSSKSTQDRQSSSVSQRGTIVQAGTVNVRATEGDLTAVGAKLQATDITLDAAKNIQLSAARNTTDLQSSQQSGNAGVGVTFGFGQQNGISFQLGAGRMTGVANGSETTYDNTLVTATNQLNLHSGNDTTLQGAQLAAKTVNVDVGGNLNITTLQDQSQYQSQQSSSGFNISLCIPPICYGQVVSGSLNLAQQDINHDYQSAVGQSGIAAGTGGFNIKVSGNTDLTGAALTSQASASSLGLSYDGSASLAQNLSSNAMGNLAGNALGNAGLPKNASESSRTLSVISPAQVTITRGDTHSQATAETLTQRDAASANGALTNTLTLQQAQQLEQQLKSAQDTARAAQIVGDVARDITQTISADKLAQADQLDKAGQSQEAQALRQTYGLGGDFQRAGQAVSAALQGLIGGDLKGALTDAAAPYLAGVVKDLTTDSNGQVNLGANTMAHSMLGALLAAAKGQNAEVGAIGGGMAPISAPLLMAQLYPGKTTDQLSEEEKQTVSALTTLTGTLAGALVAGNGAGAVTGGQTAKNEVENNSLNSRDGKNLMQAIRACAGHCDVEKLAKTIQQQEEKWDKIVADRCTGSGASLISCGNTLTGLQESMSMISSALGMAKTAEERALLMQVYQRQVADINRTLDAMQSLGASASTLEQFASSIAQVAPELIVGVGSSGKVSLQKFGDRAVGPKGITGNTEHMLGQNGVQTSSKTIWKGIGKERIDVENPAPGKRPGQIHYQDTKNNKYYYDPTSNSFYGFDINKNKIPAPQSVNNLLDDQKLKQAIERGLKQYLGEK